ncbi:hypothetical protein MB46_06635 [Arthrobacter alpinus]|uniref:hypothetical protein n=1 Tax=Arthrobacter alpinus TaxID=656366 RepID=UPI0006786938|nr:hypothetical protein [Arthrobacter alpinus]ALV45226.1 hypothetical protein MB46_06635 [Arthrobacter alpinus]
MDTTAWIWIAIAIIVVLLVVVFLLRLSRGRRIRQAEELKDRAREQASSLREDATESGLLAREKEAVAARTAADAEEAAVAAERLKIEAQRQHSAAAESDSRSKEQLHEASVIDPDVDATENAGTPQDGGVGTSRPTSTEQVSDHDGTPLDGVSDGPDSTPDDEASARGRGRHSQEPGNA